MSRECTDCGGEATQGRPTRTGTGLPIRFLPDEETLSGGSSVDLTGWTCNDCGRIRFEVDTAGGEADTSRASGECPVCDGPTVGGRLGGSGFNVRLVDRGSDLPGTDRHDLFGHACGDCGAVALYTDPESVTEGSVGTDCLSCDGGMRRTSVSTGAGSMRLIGEKQGDGALAQRERVDPMAWVCQDCGLTLLYDTNGG